jgi:arabinose-5-phosphate isomerase
MPIQELLSNYQNELASFFSLVNVKEAEGVFHAFRDCRGLLFFSGVGKSSFVAKKIASTMTATGTRASFISPTEAMHGDVGIVSSEDLFIGISKSGEADELLNLVPYIKKKGAKVVAISSNGASRLAKAADFRMILPEANEVCPLNISPTVSTISQIIVGDVLAMALMKHREFSLDDYALNHPGGSLGKKITLRVSDLMIREPNLPFCYEETTLMSSLVELSDKRAGCLLVIDSKKKLLGIFTDGDLRRALQKLGSDVLNRPMGELMTRGGRLTAPDVLAWDAMKMMEQNKQSPIMVLPVVDHDMQVLGLLKMHDILQSGI